MLKEILSVLLLINMTVQCQLQLQLQSLNLKPGVILMVLVGTIPPLNVKM